MKDEYDLTTMKSRPNPHAKQIRKRVTLRMSEDVIAYFKTMAEETSIPYQNLINFYLMVGTKTTNGMVIADVNGRFSQKIHPLPETQL